MVSLVRAGGALKLRYATSPLNHGGGKCLAFRAHSAFLEVLPIVALRPRLAQIPVEDPDRLAAPAQGQGLLAQGILALGALLVMAHLQLGLPQRL